MKKILITKTKLSLSIVLLIAITASCQLKQNTSGLKNNADSSSAKFTGDSTKILIVKEYYGNGVVKSEVSAKGNKHEGLTKNYHEDGSLMSEVNYANNMKEGISKDYYPKGKVRMEINYKKGIMDGDAKWYYETGEVYRVTPYIKGKAEGIQKEFYKNGKLKAEIPHKSGVATLGLKEYDMNGNAIVQPTIVFVTSGNSTLKMHLSNKSDKVKWYVGEIKDWSGFPKTLNLIKSDADGNGSYVYANRNSFSVYAVATTSMGNQLVLMKKFSN